MTARALRRLLVENNPLSRRERLTGEPRQLRHVRWRRGRRVVEQLSQHPGAPLNGARMLAVAAHRMDSRHAEQAAAGRILRQRDAAECVTLYAFESVVIREETIDDDVVGLEEVGKPAVVGEQPGERLVDLTAGGLLRAIVELRIEREIKLKEIEPVHRQPLRHERFHEPDRPWVVEQAVCLGLEHGRLQKLAALGQPAERRVGRCGPEEV